jgi:hypothetical protein
VTLQWGRSLLAAELALILTIQFSKIYAPHCERPRKNTPQAFPFSDQIQG